LEIHWQSITGGLVSGVTLIVKVHKLLWPSESKAVQVTIVGPTGKDEPLGGEHVVFVIVPQVVVAWGGG
jgi:hypothetical protein